MGGGILVAATAGLGFGVPILPLPCTGILLLDSSFILFGTRLACWGGAGTFVPPVAPNDHPEDKVLRSGWLKVGFAGRGTSGCAIIEDGDPLDDFIAFWHLGAPENVDLNIFFVIKEGLA